MAKILECKGLTKQFGPVVALSDVTFALETGRIVGLLGPNGSGKTTLIKLANDLLAPTAGAVLIDGMTPGVETKKLVSYLPDRMYFEERMRVRDCVAMFADFYENFDAAKAAEMLRSLGIDPGAHFKSLSKGTKEKVQLALVMSRKAKLYLLDEPIGGVDPAARDYILNTIIGNYNEAGTVVISTHLISEVEKVLDEVILLSQGRVLRQADVEDIREQEGRSVDAMFREVFKC